MKTLSPHFTETEFVCHGLDCCDGTVVVHPFLLLALERLRADIGKPITVQSGFRCRRHNMDVGGNLDSYHCRGMAADISVRGVRPDMLASTAARIPAFGGIITYQWGVHVDIGPKRRCQ
jgi:zinc D-Ala-D-Ala carboxypeptidase